MEAKREEFVLPANGGENAERAPTTDPILLQVLIDIRASLQRLENRLVFDQPPRDQHQIADDPPSAENAVPEIGDEDIQKTSEMDDHDQSLKEKMAQSVDAVEKEEDASVHETIQSEPGNQDIICGAEEESKIYYYKISDNEGTDLERRLNPFDTFQPGPQDIVYPGFPEMVSNNEWRYYKPYWETSHAETGNTIIQPCIGQGRPNFLPVWELESVDFDFEKVENLLRVPYSSSPPIGNLGMAFTTHERDMLLKQFGGLFTLPPDWRLNLEFQSHVLRREDNSNSRIELKGWVAMLSKDNQIVEFQEEVAEIEKIVQRLEDSKLRFQAIRERARSLRDGIFSLTSVKEARDARVLGENVKLLTYVTIFYLPLAFCSSLWAINDMFGTGTRGFAIITAVLAVGTYIAVFGLLHPTTQKDAIEAIRKGVSFSWITRKIKKGGDDANQNPPLKAGKGKEKEEEGISTGLQSNDAAAESPRQKKLTLLSRFRKRKVKGGEDHEMGDVGAQSNSSNSK